MPAGVEGPPVHFGPQRLSTCSRNSSVHVFDDNYQGAAMAEEFNLRHKLQKWWGQAKRDFRHRKDTYRKRDWLSHVLPCLSWLVGYPVKRNLPMDLVAGVSIGFMVVPQGMSYALLAGLPAVYGLYGAFVPVLVYALFGSSKHLAVGPVAVTSLLLRNSLVEILPAAKDIKDPNDPGKLAQVQEDYNSAAIQTTFLVALMYIAVAVLRLGFFANFLSHSVISGFTTGAALIIGLSQLKYFFGIDAENGHTAYETVINICKHLPETQWREVVMCTVWLTVLLVFKRLAKRNKRLGWLRPLGPITVCVTAIIVVVAGNLDEKGLINTVGNVPKGMPAVTIGEWTPLQDAGRQVTTAIIIFVVGFMESISISKALARKHSYKIGVTQEIMAMGIVNLFGGMFSAYATTGSFSRSAVSADVGAKTQLQGAITGLVVMLVLLFITPVFERVPYNAMGAIVLSSVLGLFELSEALFLFKANFLDFLVWLAAFLGTIFAGVEIGLAIAIGLAVVLVIAQSVMPHTAVLGRLPETQVYRNIKQYPSAEQHPNICVVRVDAPIYFANVEWIRGRVDKYRERASNNPSLGPCHFVVLDMAPVPFVDSTGMHALHELIDQLKASGQRLVLANPSRRVVAQLQRVDLLSEIGSEWIFVRTADAVKMCALHLREQNLGIDGAAARGGGGGSSELKHEAHSAVHNRLWESDDGRPVQRSLARKSGSALLSSSEDGGGGLAEIILSDSPRADDAHGAAEHGTAGNTIYQTPPQADG